jgi:hypoxanthine phosphoribosyltransferase
MTINNKEFEQYIERNQISDRLNELAEQIDADYAGKSVVMLAVLNGAFIFAGDLIRLLKVDAEVSFVKLKSYRGTASTGEV